MDKPNASKHSVLEFQEWYKTHSLIISPKFQRRTVWKTPARSYFIDSILKEVPIPPIFLRLSQNKEHNRVIREVIDGQQRLRAVLEYLEGKYALSQAIDEFGGREFEELPPDVRKRIESFSFDCQVFQNISDKDVLEIFARVNTYSVPVNAQELRNGRYFGRFKQEAYTLAHEHLEFWRENRIFTEGAIARMLEVELTSELMIAAIAGQQDKKKSIDDFYEKYDEVFPARIQIGRHFRQVIDTITETFADTLPGSEFHRPPLFYTLFCVVYHRMVGLPKIKLSTPKRKLTGLEGVKLRDAAIQLSDKVARARDEEPVRRSDLVFVNACLRQTDNIRPRMIRFETLYNLAFR